MGQVLSLVKIKTNVKNIILEYNKNNKGLLMQTYKDLNEAFVESLKTLSEECTVVNSRGTKQREVLWHSIKISDPTALSIEVPARKFKPSYGVTEWLWYLSADPNVKNIGKLASIWQAIADSDNEVESNYGRWIHSEPTKTGITQWQWVLEELLNDRDTRRASITINNSWHKGKNNKDYPCTQYLHFFIRDNNLHLGVHMRSNDAVFGFCNDVFTFCMYQQLMLNELNHSIAANDSLEEPLKLGHYYHTADSFHVYESHFKMMDKIVANYGKKYTTHGSWSGEPYPDLKKYVLRDTITMNQIKETKIYLPSQELTKEELTSLANNAMELLYV